MSAQAKRRYLDPALIQKVSALELLARRAVEGVRVGMHRSTLKGFSTEFAQHRAYIAGDNIKDIDWRVYGRSQRYYVKLFEAETNFTAHLLLDASSSMNYASGKLSKLDCAKHLAAALAYLVVKQNDSVGLAVFDSELRKYIEPKSTTQIIVDIAVELEGTGVEPRTNVGAILHEFARRVRQRGFVILFSDLLDNVDDFLLGLEHLRYRGHNVIVFQILDPFELELPMRGSWKFRGMEGEEDLVAHPQRIRESYLAELNKLLARVKKACDRCRAEYVLVNTARPLGAVLSQFLAAR
ncbi:MAG TPA: DUF58 domain-containing protein [Planctomycetota bacterium]|jgi:uncharacterized protein (DUF58 family)